MLSKLGFAAVLLAATGAACGYPALPRITDSGADSSEGGDASVADAAIDGTPAAVCGNGVVEPPEECEDNNTIDGDGCDHNCTHTACGNGIQTQGEDCDDGNKVTETCAYGMTSCSVCNATCHVVAGATSFCGDGRIDPMVEACDDSNASACGSCSGDCKTATPAAAATGQIGAPAGADLHVGDAFTIDDAFGTVATFTFFNDPTHTPGPREIRFDSTFTSVDIAAGITNAVNGSGLQITAAFTSGSNLVALTHRLRSANANGGDGMSGHPPRRITSNIAISAFTIVDMHGGQAGDCGTGVGCKQNDDCGSGRCVTGHCQPCLQDSDCPTTHCNASGACVI